jgi:hypothetical protein
MDSTTTPPAYPTPPTGPTPPAPGFTQPAPTRPPAHPSELLRPPGHASGHPVPIDPVAARQAPRDLRRPWRVVIAVLLPLGPLFVAVAFALRPFTGSEEPAVIIERILASPRTDLLLWLGFLAPGLLLLGTVAAGHLARRGAPVLATIATTINALAFGLMSGAVASGDLITVAGGRAGVDPATILTITDAIENSPITGTAMGIWVPGHILGMVLLAVALRRSRVLPRWAAVVLGVSQPIHFLAFVVLDNQYVDALAGWGLTAVGFAAVAVALLRTRDDDWDLPPSSR